MASWPRPPVKALPAGLFHVGIAKALCACVAKAFACWNANFRLGRWGVGDDNISASCTRVGCYGTATSLACADMLSATSILGLGGWGVGDGIPLLEAFRCFQAKMLWVTNLATGVT